MTKTGTQWSRVPVSLVLVVGGLCILSLAVVPAEIVLANANGTISKRMHFSYNDPSTFKLANAAQIATLRSIAQSEFSLEHLQPEDQELLDEALRFSGVEVHQSCVIDESTSARVRAFVGRWDQDRNARHHPTHGIKDLLETDEAVHYQSGWKTIYNDRAEYPYPFSEAQVLPKSIPVDQSSIQLLGRTEATGIYNALPSRLLIVQTGEDNIVAREDLAVEFVVDLDSRRITTLSLFLPKPVQVVRGIGLRELNFNYQFSYDEISDRNVLVSTDQNMKGRLWMLFRPKLLVETSLTYIKCINEAPTESYLYTSIRAINDLGEEPDDYE